MGDQTARAVDGLLEIPIGACVAHPDNPRRRFDATQLRELADSIRAQGILQPLLVRTVERGFGYQVIAGERRLRAAKLAGLEAVPAIVRELTDDQALACLVIENQQRVDVTPLEEARGYTALLKRDGWTADRLATEVGKSVSYIYQRQQLLKLRPGLQAGLEAGLLPLAHAIELARCSAEAQLEVLERNMMAHEWDNPKDPPEAPFGVALGDLREAIAETRRKLAEAPWKLDDADLVKKAGACAACPTRTGATPGLFPDAVGKADACLNRTCWADKRSAHKARAVRAFLEAHPDGVFVSSGGGRRVVDDRPVVGSWSVKQAKANAKGAVLACYVGAEDNAGVRWVTLDAEAKRLLGAKGRRKAKPARGNDTERWQRQRERQEAEQTRWRALVVAQTTHLLEACAGPAKTRAEDLGTVADLFVRTQLRDGWALRELERDLGVKLCAAVPAKKMDGATVARHLLADLLGDAWREYGQRGLKRLGAIAAALGVSLKGGKAPAPAKAKPTTAVEDGEGAADDD